MIINSLERSIQIKVCYYGPAMSGKTTTLKSLFNHFGKKKLVESIETSHEPAKRRTLFFDYGTMSFQNQEWMLKVHLYSTTGQDYYIITRPATLQGVDGIIFVADSQRDVYDRNLISWNELATYFGDAISNMPKVMAFNKQDLPEKFNPNIFLHQIDYYKFSNIDVKKTIAINGEGVLDSFEEIISLIFKNLYKSQLVSVFQ
ncbi:MAG: ATP/GTP-binding protein [Candidatus Heimdallarchaeota archaeon]